jgi:drug/metabolite transporter (DMT)-like permease
VYVFAIATLLSLGVLAVAMMVRRFVYENQRPEMWMLLLTLLGVGVAWIADFSMWARWGIDVRADWIGITLTGLALGGMAQIWHEVVGLAAGLERKYNDEAATLERAEELRRIA